MRWRAFISVSNLQNIEFPLRGADHSLRPHPFVALDSVGKQADALQHVVDDQRARDVKLKVARRAADGYIVAHHLCAEHGHSFALRRVELAGHDRATGLVFRNGDLAQT